MKRSSLLLPVSLHFLEIVPKKQGVSVELEGASPMETCLGSNLANLLTCESIWVSLSDLWSSELPGDSMLLLGSSGSDTAFLFFADLVADLSFGFLVAGLLGGAGFCPSFFYSWLCF